MPPLSGLILLVGACCFLVGYVVGMVNARSIYRETYVQWLSRQESFEAKSKVDKC